jgi:hypothetical protein
VTSGLLKGQVGWVESVLDETVSILECIAGETQDDASNINVNGALNSIALGPS